LSGNTLRVETKIIPSVSMESTKDDSPMNVRFFEVKIEIYRPCRIILDINVYNDTVYWGLGIRNDVMS
jgi:hypothetical protein